MLTLYPGRRLLYINCIVVIAPLGVMVRPAAFGMKTKRARQEYNKYPKKIELR